MKREIGFYIFQTYLPSILIVILSWASFWIDHEAVPARISVGLLTVLTITTQLSGSRAQLPRVPYIKVSDDDDNDDDDGFFFSLLARTLGEGSTIHSLPVLFFFLLFFFLLNWRSSHAH